MRQTFILCIAAILALGTITVSCKGKKAETKPVKGVMEEPVREGSASVLVNATLDRHVIDKNFEMILNDTVNNVHVWSLVSCDTATSSDGFGIVVAKDGRATIFANIRHGNTPAAHYNASTGELWISGVSIEGTGTHVERLYRIGFSNENPANIIATIDPYEMQQELCKRLQYSVNGENITLYNGETELTTVTNTVTDMGGFFDDAVWIGEQLRYDFDGDALHVLVTPGVSFVTGKVLHYDDMPDITASVTLHGNGSFTVSDINVAQSSH